jgi:carbamoyltransferase
MATYYVGLAASFHDPAMAIVAPDGEVLFAEAQERYLQDKRAFNAVPDHILRAPKLIRQYCGKDAEVVVAVSWSKKVLKSLWTSSLVDVPGIGGLLRPVNDFFMARSDHLVWPWPRFDHLRQGMLSTLSLAGHNLGALRDQGFEVAGIRRYDHHLTHAATACYTSPFEEAACAVIDGYGEWSSTNFYSWRDGAFTSLAAKPKALAQNSGSLGMFYSKVCALCGFDTVQGEEWKVMGLAPYGSVDAEFYELLRPLVQADGLALHNPQGRDTGRRLKEVQALMAAAKADPDPSVYQRRRADLGRTGQEIFAEVAGELLAALYALHPSDNLAFGGGCALNSSYSGRILSSTPFKALHVPMAPGDDGNALGAALLAWAQDHPDQARAGAGRVQSPYLGSTAASSALERMVRFGGFTSLQHLPDGQVVTKASQLLAEGRIIGWFQDRAEFGPRALGNRSILADPRDPAMKDRINDRVKFREEFRPFAPSILHEHGPDWFEDYQSSPYMERTLVFRPEVRQRVPAVVHEDFTGRLQSVTEEINPRYHALISAFYGLTGVPMLLNTSFNVMGKPIVHSVEDAIAVFATSGLDALVINDYLIEKQGAGA